MMRALVALAFALVAAALTASSALADGGPHGQYDKLADGTVGMTDKCAACHRVHQGQSQGFLLKRQTQYQLCASCHDGTGSRLDVLDGIKLEQTQSTRPTGLITGTATLTGTLNGGGFEYVNGTQVTSKHNVKLNLSDPGQSQPWGYLANTGALSGTLSQPLTCTSCHNAHGSPNYRMFIQKVNSKFVSVLAYYGGTFINDEGARGLESGVPNDKYVKEYYGSNGLGDSGGFSTDMSDSDGTTYGTSTISGTLTTVNGMATLCGACHSSYPSSSAKSLPSNPWNITNYRHRTEMPYDVWTSPKYSGPVPNNPELNPATIGSLTMPKLRLASNGTDTDKIVTCLTCHRAHGSATQMTGWASKVSFGGLTPDSDNGYGVTPSQQNDTQLAGGKSTSTLLYTDNRGMCEACHQW